jgi:hypothetical protein
MISKPTSIDPDVVARKLEGEMVLVQMRTNRIFTLNATGSRIWELIESGCDESALVDRLRDEFDVSETMLRREVDSLLTSLRAEGLIADA